MPISAPSVPQRRYNVNNPRTLLPVYDEQGTIVPGPGDVWGLSYSFSVLDRRGKVVGHVTSCAIDRDGYLLGQAIVPESLTEPGAALYIYQLGGGARPIKGVERADLGGRLPMPDAATVLTRFPERKK